MNQKIKILFVDDDPEDVQLTLLAMEDVLKSFEVVLASDGSEALNYLLGKGPYAGRDAGEKPALAILDLNLPRVNGIEVLQHLHSEWGPELGGLQIAVLSSAPVEQYRAVLEKFGVKVHLQKPISAEQTRTMVRELSRLLPVIPRPAG